MKNPNKKITIILTVVMALIGGWYIYQITRAKPVDPSAMDGASSARQYMEYQIEFQRRETASSTQIKEACDPDWIKSWKPGTPVPQCALDEANKLQKENPSGTPLPKAEEKK